MTQDILAMIKSARREAKRAIKTLQALLADGRMNGHLLDYADSSVSCLDAFLCEANIEIADAEFQAKQEKEHEVELL